jgi:hypothetical protein
MISLNFLAMISDSLSTSRSSLVSSPGSIRSSGVWWQSQRSRRAWSRRPRRAEKASMIWAPRLLIQDAHLDQPPCSRHSAGLAMLLLQGQGTDAMGRSERQPPFLMSRRGSCARPSGTMSLPENAIGVSKLSMAPGDAALAALVAAQELVAGGSWPVPEARHSRRWRWRR